MATDSLPEAIDGVDREPKRVFSSCPFHADRSEREMPMIMKYLILDCRKTAFLVSRTMDGDLPWFQRFRAWLHLRICPPCAGNHQHLAALHQLAGPCLEEAYPTASVSARLTPQARVNIFSALKETYELQQREHGAH